MLQTIERYVPNNDNGYVEAEVQAMQRTVLNIFDRWGLSDAEAVKLLGDISTKTLGRWRQGQYGRVNRDLADRMSNILGIHKALRIVFREVSRGYRWISAPNEAFGGNSALDVMKNGGMEDLQRVRRYLDSMRGGW